MREGERRPRRLRDARLIRRALPLLAAVVLAAVCSSGSPQAPPSPSRVKLDAAPGELRSECAAAADQLGFAVPCPDRVPATAGRGMSCPPPSGAMPAPCVALEGLSQYPVFFLEFTGFDVPPEYVGIDDKAMGHVAVEARPQRESPPRPCIGGKRLRNGAVSQWTAAEYGRPKGTHRVHRPSMHGEGSHAGPPPLERIPQGP